MGFIILKEIDKKILNLQNLCLFHIKALNFLIYSFNYSLLNQAVSFLLSCIYSSLLGDIYAGCYVSAYIHRYLHLFQSISTLIFLSDFV